MMEQPRENNVSSIVAVMGLTSATVNHAGSVGEAAQADMKQPNLDQLFSPLDQITTLRSLVAKPPPAGESRYLIGAPHAQCTMCPGTEQT